MAVWIWFVFYFLHHVKLWFKGPRNCENWETSVLSSTLLLLLVHPCHRAKEGLLVWLGFHFNVYMTFCIRAHWYIETYVYVLMFHIECLPITVLYCVYFWSIWKAAADWETWAVKVCNLMILWRLINYEPKVNKLLKAHLIIKSFSRAI